MTEKDDASVTDTSVTDVEPSVDEIDRRDESLEDVSEGESEGAVQSRRRLVGAVGMAVLAIALIASVGATAWLYFFQFRPDQETDSEAAKVAIDAASQASVSLLTYSPETLDKDFAAAKTQLTGDFLDYYTDFTEKIVTPAAKQKQVKTSAAVVQAALSQLSPESAEVLLFINQTTTSKENPDGAYAASSVKVGMTKIDGAWKISSFDPV
ncbi:MULTISPECIES: hypothetical protein [Mycolicibacterium]|uniref:Twin-arginine translocation pathway signal n=2 Tax=unclassified Mycobacterium TaxID=2642494 RepID=A0A5Q5BMY2_MYCSS|nr:hypothetical protein [Mycolicibacterium monacense]OBB71441.1 hypothetical protein A6B34_16755 [Mycolicibacterium monacense]OBF52935.1 hypothetical protein A5778_12340 [Mycolicibacterium monacense]